MRFEQVRLGQCLCGQSSIEIPDHCTTVGICHCSMCRKVCSAPWMGIQSPTQETIFKGETIKTYQSSKLAKRKFCSNCGATLTHEPKNAPYIVVSAGIFDDQSKFTISHEIFTDKQPSWYELDGDPDRDKLTTNQTILRYLPKMIWYNIKSWIPHSFKFYGNQKHGK